MPHKELVVIFAQMFPAMKIKRFWRKGPTAIRVRLSDGTDVVFTYFSKTEWKLESMALWEKSVDGL